MAVYDDTGGWDVLPYLGAGEFYLDYGNMDYTITAPAGLVIVGSGELRNPSEVLTQVQLGRLAEGEGKPEGVIHPYCRRSEGGQGPCWKGAAGLAFSV
ncbi:hypothetical protein ACQ86N_11085 [Puia sp. P3]|uniref:hypothetical protein n=1 Tax=Puia sp. P3 TaxID=3423952 RepID=UPI003D66D3DF